MPHQGSAFGHVHGLGVDPADDRLYYVASHVGVFRETESGFERATDPQTPDALVVADQRGELMHLEAGGQPRAISGAPPVGFLDWSPAGDLVGLGSADQVPLD